MRCDGQRTTDQRQWVTEVAKEFEEDRWFCDNPDDETFLNDLGGTADHKVTVHVDDVITAADTLKKPWRLDCNSVCAAAVKDCPNIARAVAPVFSSLLGSDESWDAVNLQGFVKNNKRGNLESSGLRAVFPQTIVMLLLSSLVALAIQPAIDCWSLDQGLDHCVMGGSRGCMPHENLFFSYSGFGERPRPPQSCRCCNVRRSSFS